MKYKVLILTAITFITTCLGVSAKNILSLKESITDNAIVYPSSFETNTKEMMENWYLKNYAIIDESGIETRDYGLVSDAEYIRRLKALPTEIEMPYNQIVKSYIERYVVKSRTLVAQMLGMCPYYMPIFEEALERHQMPLELKYIPIIESALNPNAVSPAGAGGLWQFMITTAKGVGLTVDTQLDERRDPYKSSEKAAVYFKQLYDTYHDWSLAIAAYNCGPGNVNKAIRRAGTDNPDFWEIYNYLPRETRGYVPAFIAANYVMTYYQKHNINPTLTKKPLIIDTVSVTKRIHLDQISQVLNIPLDEIQILNPQYRKGVINGSVARPLTLALPSQQIYSYIMAEDRIENHNKSIYEQRGEVKPGEVRASDVAGLIDEDGKIIYHTVTDGEDFMEIADRYGMEYDALKELNNLTSTRIQPGQVLQVINMNPFIDETVMGSSRGELLADRNSANNGGGYNNNGNGYNSGNNNNRNNSGNHNNDNNGGSYNGGNHNNGNNGGNTNSGHSSREQRTVPPPPKTEQPKTQPKAVPEKNTQKNDKNNNTAKNDNKSAKNDNKTAKNDNKTAKNDNKNNKNDNKNDKGNSTKKEEKKPTTTKHKVKEGDNITKIANQYGISMDDLSAANNLSGDHIEIGQNLIIPEKGYAKKHPQPKQQQTKQQQTKQQGNNANTQNNKNKNNNASTQQNNKGNNKGNNTATQQNNKGNNKGNTATQQNKNNKGNNATTQQNKNNKGNNATTQQNKNNKGNNATTQQNKNNKGNNANTQNNKNKNNNASTQQNKNNKGNNATQQNNKGNNKTEKKK